MKIKGRFYNANFPETPVGGILNLDDPSTPRLELIGSIDNSNPLHPFEFGSVAIAYGEVETNELISAAKLLPAGIESHLGVGLDICNYEPEVLLIGDRHVDPNLVEVTKIRFCTKYLGSWLNVAPIESAFKFEHEKIKGYHIQLSSSPEVLVHDGEVKIRYGWNWTLPGLSSCGTTSTLKIHPYIEIEYSKSVVIRSLSREVSRIQLLLSLLSGKPDEVFNMRIHLADSKAPNEWFKVFGINLTPCTEFSALDYRQVVARYSEIPDSFPKLVSAALCLSDHDTTVLSTYMYVQRQTDLAIQQRFLAYCQLIESFTKAGGRPPPDDENDPLKRYVQETIDACPGAFRDRVGGALKALFNPSFREVLIRFLSVLQERWIGNSIVYPDDGVKFIHRTRQVLTHDPGSGDSIDFVSLVMSTRLLGIVVEMNFLQKLGLPPEILMKFEAARMQISRFKRGETDNAATNVV